MASSDLPASAEQQQVDSTDLRGPIPPQSVQLFRLFDLVKLLNAAGCSQKAPDHHHQSTLAWWRPSVTDLIVFFQHCNKRFEEQSGFSAQVFIRRHQPRVQIISLTQDRAHSPSRQTHPSCEALFGLLGFFFSKAAFKGNRIKAIIVFLRQWAVADRRDLQTEGWNSLQTGPLKVVVWLLSCSCLMTQTRWLAFLERHTVNYSWAGIRGVCVLQRCVANFHIQQNPQQFMLEKTQRNSNLLYKTGFLPGGVKCSCSLIHFSFHLDYFSHLFMVILHLTGCYFNGNGAMLQIVIKKTLVSYLQRSSGWFVLPFVLCCCWSTPG